VLLLVALCLILVYFPLKKIQSAKNAALTCFFLIILVSVLDFKLSANSLAANDSYLLNTNIAASSMNNLRLAVTTFDRTSSDQFIQPANSASELLRESNVEEEGQFTTVILIVVESLGLINDPVLNQFQMEPIFGLKNVHGVALKSGTVEFEGSTVPGELRELCGIRLLTVHPNVSTLPTASCLPRLFGDRGFKTLAIHGFIGTLFSRSRWYPALHFDDIWFAPKLDELIPKANRCGIAFHGICDKDIWKLIVNQNLTVSNSPRFIYWLTLSAHLPVEHPLDMNDVNCSKFEALNKENELCNLVFQHRLLFSEIANSIQKSQLSRTVILLVGDHSPPFLNHEIRSLFDTKKVPYVEIKIP
ncbi:MAG: sulfatase-like hydrolase/transferase, partial [Lysobacterales bacterium]